MFKSQEEQPCAVMASLRSKHLVGSLVSFKRLKGGAEKQLGHVPPVWQKTPPNSSASFLEDVLLKTTTALSFRGWNGVTPVLVLRVTIITIQNLVALGMSSDENGVSIVGVSHLQRSGGDN